MVKHLDQSEVPASFSAIRERLRELHEAEGMAMLDSLAKQQPPDAYFPGVVDQILDWFREHPEFEDLKPRVGMMVHEAIVKLGVSMPVPHDLAGIRAMMPELERQWFAKGWAKGWAKGRAKRLRDGRAWGLVRILVSKFGPLDPGLRARIDAADLPTVKSWFGRAIHAPDLSSVFDSPPPEAVAATRH